MSQQERKQLNNILNTLLIATLLLLLALLSFQLVAPTVYAVAIAVTGMIASVMMLWLSLRGQLSITRFCLPLLTFIIGAALCVSHKGLYDEAMYTFPLTLALVGLLQGKRGIIIYTFLILILITLITLGAQIGILQYPTIPSYTSYLQVALILTYFSAVLYVIIDHLTRSLSQALDNEIELAARNRELHAIQESLENQVNERSKHAESARFEAEAARKALEIQVWQTSGQVKLSEKMRGDQDISSLAGNIIRQLCQHLDAEVGALFVKKGDCLELAGGFSYNSSLLPTRFQMGSGVVGQCAVDQCGVLIDWIPEDSIRIYSGLGDCSPRQVMVAPFTYNNAVMGVIELATLKEFSNTQLEFLNLVSESIGIAFRTAQTREQVNGLLAETQRQAKEMQAQEEELRAINLEIQSQNDAARLKGTYETSG